MISELTNISSSSFQSQLIYDYSLQLKLYNFCLQH